MTYNQLIAHFKSDGRAALALGTSRQRVHNWSLTRLKKVPLDMQILAERVTAGALRAEISKEDRRMLADNARRRAA